MGVRRLRAGGLRSVVAATAQPAGKARKVWLKQLDLEGSCLQLLRGVVVDGRRVLSACRPKALQATPLQTMGEAKLFNGGCYDGA